MLTVLLIKHKGEGSSVSVGVRLQFLPCTQQVSSRYSPSLGFACECGAKLRQLPKTLFGPKKSKEAGRANIKNSLL